MREVGIMTDCCCLCCILIITISPSRPHTLLSGNWLSKLLLHCDKLSTGGRVAGRSPERQTEAFRGATTHLLGGTVCMMGPWWPQLHSKPVESAAGTGSYSSLHRLCPLVGQTGAGAGRRPLIAPAPATEAAQNTQQGAVPVV